MSHLPYHAPPQWELFRNQSVQDQVRQRRIERSIRDAQQDNPHSTGLAWDSQRHVNQVAPAEMLNPDNFDTFNYRYQVYARPPCEPCVTAPLAEASDCPRPPRYNVRRVAVNKPCANEPWHCVGHWQQKPWTTAGAYCKSGNASNGPSRRPAAPALACSPAGYDIINGNSSNNNNNNSSNNKSSYIYISNTSNKNKYSNTSNSNNVNGNRSNYSRNIYDCAGLSLGRKFFATKMRTLGSDNEGNCNNNNDSANVNDTDASERPKEPGWGTYKLVMSQQYRQRPDPNYADGVKLPPGLEEYREFTRRCPHYKMGRYDRSLPTNEMVLPNNRAPTLMASSRTPFRYLVNPRNILPPIFEPPQPLEAPLEWTRPTFLDRMGCQWPLNDPQRRF